MAAIDAVQYNSQAVVFSSPGSCSSKSMKHTDAQQAFKASHDRLTNSRFGPLGNINELKLIIRRP